MNCLNAALFVIIDNMKSFYCSELKVNHDILKSCFLNLAAIVE